MPQPVLPFPSRPAAAHAVEGACALPAGRPTVLLDVGRRRLSLAGASCLDDAIAFYGPLIGRLRACLDRSRRDAFDVDIALGSVDAGSEKMLFALFDTLHEGALAGNAITVHWHRQGADRRCRWFVDSLRDRFPRLRFIDRGGDGGPARDIDGCNGSGGQPSAQVKKPQHAATVGCC